MITEDYVGFEIARLLEQKGFNEKCHKVYDEEDRCIPFNFTYSSKVGEKFCKAPTLQMAMKWLREVHKIDISVCRELDDYGGWCDGYIAGVFSNGVYMDTIRDVVKDLSYEEVAELAIKYCLTNLI